MATFEVHGFKMEKKELERSILKSFQEKYDLFPRGEIIQTERPDFIIRSNGKTTGIEIAEIFQDSHLKKSSELKAREVTQNEFGEALLQFLVSKQMRKQFFMLDVSFTNDKYIHKRQINSLVSQCWIPCMEFIWNNTQGFIRIENIGETLPEIIDSIYIQLADYDQEPIYCNSQGGTVDTLRFEHIAPILRTHEKALQAYRKCDEQWLVIREGNYYAGSFSDVSFDIPIPIISAFDKVFILRTRASSEQSIIRLK